ncbi:hypothetical protein LX16_1915 [Stackebrandtia albiflava]|uniref:DUF4386 family protein n=1 Tax=Stackebrandtia albiflava TaxID=406432 RepID=A0A562VE78_9ACTN|nr:hypothetical protein [Stackebrandtia albiflava]TWJ16190.1 hypothetical protein LX16_1915 [Stackebrandtia albiflava]
MTHRRIAALSFMTAPLLLLIGWAVMRLGGAGGAEPGWTVAHVAWVLDNIGLAVVVITLFRRSLPAGLGGRLVAGTTLVVGLAGAAAMLAQMVIDLVVGFATTDRSEMQAMSESIHDVPGVEPVVYVLGPVMLFVALLVQAVQLGVRRRMSWWFTAGVATSVLIAGGERLVDVPLRLPQAVAAVLLAAAFWPVGRRMWREAADPAVAVDRPATPVGVR